jgi:glycine cleavage system H protein
MYPEHYRYTKEHEWVEFVDGVGTIGITDHAQQELGDIVYVEVPKAGIHVELGKTFAVVESVKAASDIFAPISGEVVAGNEALAATPELLNSDPHNQGWIAKIKLSAPDELKALLSAAEYQAFVAG